VRPGWVRPVDYEVVELGEAARMGVPVGELSNTLSPGSQVCVVRCVDFEGAKVTYLGDAKHFRKLLTSGLASDPRGLSLAKLAFPIAMPGWARGVAVGA
jgi:hypothetical protein